VVFEEAGAAGSLGPEPKSRLLVSGFQLFCGAALLSSSTTTITKSTTLTLEVPVAFCAEAIVEFGSALRTKVAVR